MSEGSSLSHSAAQVASLIEEAATSIVDTVLNRFYAIHLHLHSQHDAAGKRLLRAEILHHLEALTAAIRHSNPRTLADYAQGMAGDLASRRTGYNLAHLLELIGQEIHERLGEEVWHSVQPPLDAALRALNGEPGNLPLVTEISPVAVMQAYLQAVLNGDRLAAQDVVLSAIAQGLTVRQVYLDVFQPALYEIGALWEQGQVSVAQEHLATVITQTILSRIYTDVTLTPRNGRSAIVACLDENYHEIGPRMIADFLHMAGYDTRFLGANTPRESLLHMIDDIKPDVVGLPSTMQHHVDVVQQAIEHIRADFASYRPTIMVGGIAFNLVDGLWQRVGADVWRSDGGQAVDELIETAGGW
ncbi:MAG: hypothetical protein GYB65_01455 [Chloroflexi bacterium]|nr:hypothetical protein [Chloroflexota bacterium]